MANNQPRKIFLNVAVRNLKRSMEFFATLGFTFNPNFTDDNAACMIVNEDAGVMLLTEPYFKTFTQNEICDTRSHTEGFFALSCGSRAEVDEMVNKAIKAGGKHAMAAVDHGFMYIWSFYDLDGHHWEVLWMNPTAIAA
ncbi:MAG: VOC family protein [Bryobacteraceae bacterium]